MNLIDAIREKILKFLKLDYLNGNPNNERYTFINDAQNIIKSNVEAYKIWYLGDSDELLNYYTNQELYGNNDEPIYNRNKRNYFWGISSDEGAIKRVHSGVPNAIVTTLVNAIGSPDISSSDTELKNAINNIIKKNNFASILSQQQMPLTMVEGWGAYKINFDKNLIDVPIIQYYEAQDCEFVYKSGVLIGVIFKDYYKYKNKDYVMIETRRIADNNSYIEYNLFRLNNNDDVSPVEFNEVPELANFDGKNLMIPNFNKVLAVPCKFFFDPLNKNYGRSIYAGKIDLFDDLDQVLSQASQTCKVSTPVEYYPVDLLERNGRNGQPLMPKVYNRQFIKKEGIPNGDGNMNNGQIQTTQPNLFFDKYNLEAHELLNFILVGIMSPATLGIGVATKDNAKSQREKEKITLMTRNNIINRECDIIKELITLCLYVNEYMNSGVISLKEYDFSVKFEEYANPSFDSKLQTLSSAWRYGGISTKKYVDMLYTNKMSDSEKVEEIEYIERNRDRLREVSSVKVEDEDKDINNYE